MVRSIPPELGDWIAIVVDDNRRDLLRYLRRRVAEPEDAADLLGRVFLAVWEQGTRVPTTDRDARMWCFGIARNMLREHRRGVARQVALADDLRAHLRHAPHAQDGADTQAERNLAATDVRHALSRLDERSRELVMLVHWDGFSIADSARILDLNESSARTRYGRALKRLERQLAAQPHATTAGGVTRVDVVHEG